MKKNVLTIALLLLSCIYINAQRQFITLWDTRIEAKTNSTQIEYIWIQEKYNKRDKFDIYWEKYDNPNVKGKASLKPDERIINLPEPGIYKLIYKIPEIEDDVMRKDWQKYNFERWIPSKESFSGVYRQSSFENVKDDASKLIDVLYWNTIVEGKNWVGLSITAAHFFYKCDNLDISAEDKIEISTNATGMFEGCKKLRGNYYFKNWKVYIQYGNNMFKDCEQFTDAPIEYWDMSNLMLAEDMFKGCTKFNRPIGYWNTEKLVFMPGMFHGAKSFNQNLSGWNMYAFLKKTMNRESQNQYYLDKNKRIPYTYMFDTVNTMPDSYMPHINDNYTVSIVAKDLCVETLLAIRKNYSDNCKSVEKYLKMYNDAVASSSAAGEKEYKKNVFSYSDYAITNLKALQMEMEKCSVFNKLFTTYAKEIPDKIKEIEQFKTNFASSTKVNLFKILIAGFEGAVANYSK
ncbi:MAG: BspA family leucine-rich repeat surface protein [Chitinophagaceae bacterium]